MQVAGYVLWPRAVWLCRAAVTHRRLTFLCQGGLQITDDELNDLVGSDKLI